MNARLVSSRNTAAARRRCGTRRSSVSSSRISRDRLVLRLRVPAARRRTSVRRLGFLVAGACLIGLHGAAVESVDHHRDAAEQPEGSSARVAGARGRERPVGVVDRSCQNITEDGDPVDDEELAQLRPAVDGALVTHQPEGGAEARAAGVRRVRPQHRLPHRLRGLPDLRHGRRIGPQPLLARTEVRGRRVLRDARSRAGSRRSAAGTDVRPARGPSATS